MSELIRMNVWFRVTEPHRDEFYKLMRERVATMEDRAPGTLSYEYFVGEDGIEHRVSEVYASGEALITHNALAQAPLVRMGEIVETLHIEVCGDLSDEVRAVFADWDWDVVTYRPLVGFNR